MRKNFILMLITLFTSSAVFSQQLNYHSIKFAQDPSIHNIEDINLNEAPAIIIQDHRYIQIAQTYQSVSTYYTIHKIIKVNNDAGIEKFNKVYIQMSSNDKLLDLQVRTIDDNGQIKKFDKNNLKELENVEDYGNFKIFAVEGMVKGGELEYIYTVQMNPKSFGREIYQRDVPVCEAKFELKSPKGIYYITKSYNGFPECSSSTDEKTITARDIPALTDEGYSSYKSKLMRVDYKIQRNAVKSNIISWQSISQNLYESIYSETGSSQAKKFLSGLSLEGKSDFEKIKKIEKELKENFSIKNNYNDDYSNVKLIFKNHIANEFGIAKAYIKCWEYLNIHFEIVYTGSRFLGTIDEDFAHYMDLRDILFYFPELNKYVCPSHNYMRIGQTPNVIAGNNGLFITTKNNINDHKLMYLNYRIDTIEYMRYHQNNKGTHAIITINNELNEAKVEHKNFIQGYEAYVYRFIYSSSDKEKKEEFIHDILLSAIDDGKIISYSVENDSIGLSSDNSKYFICNAIYTSESLIEKAGENIFISIGKIIGKQVELYEEQDRTTDVLLQNAKEYNHKIILNIPAGYICKGLDKLIVDNPIYINNELVMQYKSDYKYENNVLEINIKESYRIIELDKNNYNDYRKVANSAADFNKVVLVFEPDSLN